MIKKYIFIFFIVSASLLCGYNSLYVSGDTFEQLSQQAIDNIGTKWFLTKQMAPFYPEQVEEHDVIFVRPQLLDMFFSHYHPHIKHRYVLLTHNSDFSVPGKFSSFLNDPKIIAWFGQNPDITYHPKFHPLPIGLANARYRHGNVDLVQRMQARAGSSQRKILAYLNFVKKNCPAERSRVQKIFTQQKFCKKAAKRPYHQYLQDLLNAKFVISPRGNGLDCHRTWEAILMGAIPIVKSSPLDPLLADLPVLIVHDWRQVTKKFLERKYREIKSRNWDLQKLYIQFWEQEIKRVAYAG